MNEAIEERDLIINVTSDVLYKHQSTALKRAGIFGSFAYGGASKQSDVDIILDYDLDSNNFQTAIDYCVLCDIIINTIKKKFKREVDILRKEAVETDEDLNDNIKKDVLWFYGTS